MNRSLKVVGIALALALITAACGGGGGSTGGADVAEEDLQRGGTLRVSMLSDVSAAFDPAKEYYQVSWGLFRCCLLRTLITFPGVEAAEGGNDLVPDLAELPEVSEDGLTWTFKLKGGINYAPPFQDTEVVAEDFVRAIEREACTECASNGYSFYYSVIEGFDEFSEGKAGSISGVSAPDDQTLEITLTQATGDFGYRMAMPAMAPLPEGAADGHDRDYGRYLVATGPYMFEGSEDLDFSLPVDEQSPVSGYKPGKSITLVRNPSWDAETDETRPAYVDRIEAVIGGTEEDIFNKIETGDLNLHLDAVPPAQVLQQYNTDPQLKELLFTNPADGTRYISMNIAEPPFDDIHVRKALNLVLDKDGMRRLRGGPQFGEIAGHTITNSLLADELADYDPYASENGTGDVEAAKEEMSQSKYDSDGDGECDDPVCEDVLSVTDEGDPYPDQAALIQDNFEQLGMTLDVKSFERTVMYDKCLDPAAHTALCLGPGWGKDFPDATTFAEPLFGSASLGPDACCNYALVGASPEHLKKYDYEIPEVPSADEQIKACDPLQGDERIQCYVELDQHIMENVVPWVPYLFDNDVFIVNEDTLNFTYDQFSGQPALDKIAIRQPAGE